MNLFKRFYLNRKLVSAVKKNDVLAASNLLDQGASPQALDLKRLGVPVLHNAAAQGLEEMTLLLIARGADAAQKDIARVSALHAAAKSGNIVIVQALLEKKTDVNERTGDGNTALHYAVLHGHKALAQFLLDHGANPDIKNSRGETSLHLSTGSKDAEMPSLLIERGADLKAATHYNWTALHMAAYNGDTAMTALLLDKKIDITIRTNDGNKTAYGLAIAAEHPEIITLIAPHERKIQEERDNQWMMLSDKKVVRVYIEGEGDIGCTMQAREITELFNFRTRRYKAWSKNLSTKAESFITRGFDDLYKAKEKGILNEAFEEMNRLCKDARRPAALEAIIAKDAATEALPLAPQPRS